MKGRNRGKQKVRKPKKDFWGIRKGVRPLSEEYEYLRNKHMARILCKSMEDPLKRLIFMDEDLRRYDYGKKRHGGPRQDWVKETLKSSLGENSPKKL